MKEHILEAKNIENQKDLQIRILSEEIAEKKVEVQDLNRASEALEAILREKA